MEAYERMEGQGGPWEYPASLALSWRQSRMWRVLHGPDRLGEKLELRVHSLVTDNQFRE